MRDREGLREREHAELKVLAYLFKGLQLKQKILCFPGVLTAISKEANSFLLTLCMLGIRFSGRHFEIFLYS